MPNTTRNSLFVPIAGLVASLYAGAYFLNHQEDFLIYLKASQALLDSRNPYLATENRYVYGPFLAIFLIPFSKLDLSLAKILWGILNLSSGLATAWFLLRLRSKRISENDYFLMLILIFTSFSFRNNTGQGQAVSIVLALSLLAVQLCKSKTEFVSLSALVVMPVLEIKPYLALGVIAYLFLCVKKRILIYIGLYAILANIFYLLFFKITYLDWLYTLEIRSKSIASGYDQSSISSILKFNFSMEAKSRVVIVVFYYALLCLLIYRYKSNIKRNLFPFSLAISCVASPFFHSHDLLFAVVGLMLVVNFNRNLDLCHSILLISILILHIGWTSNHLSAGLFLCTIVVVTLGLAKIDLSRTQLCGILVASWLWTVAFHLAFDLENYSRVHAFNFLSLLYAFLIFLYVIKDGNRKMSVLSPSRDNLGSES